MWSIVPVFEELNCLKISIDDFNLEFYFNVANIVEHFLVPGRVSIGSLHVPESRHE